MDKGIIRKSICAAAVALAIGVSISASAQFGGDPTPPYTPAPDARDLKSVLFNWPWHQGMLRGIEEHELIVSLEYRGEGTVQINGQACKLEPFKASERPGELGTAGYRIDTSYQKPGSRTQITCTLPNGQKYHNIEVVSGTYAWDEDIPGAGLVAGQGKAVSKPNEVDERLIRLWASPQGAPKAALAGAGIPLRKVWRNPGGLLEAGTQKLGQTSVTWDGKTPVITFPIPGVDGATAVARLDDRFMTQSVVVTHGRDKYEFTYSDYKDYNNELNPIEVMMAGKMTESKNGKVMREITTKQTETGSVYVVVPVPKSVSGHDPDPVEMYGTDQKAPVLDSTEPTPRMADGHPDLSGAWAGGNKFFIWRYGNRRCAPEQLEGCSTQWNQTVDFEFEAASRFGPNRPLYKPENWDKVVYLDMWTNKEDPIMTCQPMGEPREGPPRRIFQTASDITFLYPAGGDGGGGYSDFRVISLDGKMPSERELVQTKYTGHSWTHWEGDTLVVESIGFTPETWLARGGFFHSENMKVTERLTRKGDQLLYESTVEDPDVLLRPWTLDPLLMTLAKDDGPGADRARLIGVERGVCQSYELDDISWQIHH
ncbi:MAG TPA: hypothetical protein VFV10_00320 [Gammaproteobacteria bacterium]|nr:hypothetical protein [Gammaproteobacteria bacterium]